LSAIADSTERPPEQRALEDDLAEGAARVAARD